MSSWLSFLSAPTFPRPVQLLLLLRDLRTGSVDPFSELILITTGASVPRWQILEWIKAFMEDLLCAKC